MSETTKSIPKCVSVGTVCLLSFLSFAASGETPMPKPVHVTALNERVFSAEDGLLLGNGDLSVSVYQTADRIIFRFGKGDVWDRRLDLSEDPKPAHISEIAHGIEVERWKCGPYGGPVEALNGTKDEKRMKELCQGAPPSYVTRPYPCPKPVGELAMQLPPDLKGLQLRQQLFIEEARILIECSWPSGVAVNVECFVPPNANVLVVDWKVKNWTPRLRLGNGVPPVWFSLYRWADPTIQSFASRFFGDFRHGAFRATQSPKVTPLPAPVTKQMDGQWLIEQAFQPEPTFKDGFRYLLAPLSKDFHVEPVDMSGTGEARLHLMPAADLAGGTLVVAVTSSSDPGSPEAEMGRLGEQLSADLAAAVKRWADENATASKQFWAKSRVAIADPLAESLWYETLHARRCTYKAGKAPPGLFLPSTVQDYSHWHGDYHLNYNFQEPFWGDYAANHLELGDAYFDGVNYLIRIGRKIAHDYYGARGVFIQLSGFPIEAVDDPLGVAPMGRMAYMTGWAMNHYWGRYLYTLDRDWLRTLGYPVTRECALFYTDFLGKGPDGLYHAFPSNQGEDGFSGNPKDYTDRAQVMQHARYCLRAAIRASEILGLDADMRSEFRDRLENMAGDDGRPPLKLTGLEKELREANPPEFSAAYPYQVSGDNVPKRKPWPAEDSWLYQWYFGQYPWFLMQRVRNHGFDPALDYPAFQEMIRRWRHPNGLVWAMAKANYGNAGAWTESLGCFAPLQEMMFQSWGGVLRFFPCWPKDLDARFEGFRAEGAFLVKGAWEKGALREVEIFSEKGSKCRLEKPWKDGLKVVGPAETEVNLVAEGNFVTFETVAGGTYKLGP